MAVEGISKAQASEYEHIVLVDKSGSMGEKSLKIPGKTRWQEAQEHISGLTNFLSDVDENGLDIILFGTNAEVHRHIKTPEAVAEIFTKASPKGSTNLAAAFVEAEKIRQESPGRGFMIHVFTDGLPDSESGAAEAISKMGKSMKKDSELAIGFLQIGDDPDATRYLKQLDDNLQKKYQLPFDCVNTMTAAESADLSYEQIMWLTVND